jgi:tetratricopeptide (TPR) repeat protein
LLTVCSKIDLGHLYEQLEKLDQAELQYVSAYQILQAHFPHSLELGKISTAIGMLYKDLIVRPAESEQYLQRAISVYSEQAPQTLEFAVCLYALGCLYEDKMNQLVQAEARYRQACELCTSHFPKSLCLAFCLKRLGELCVGSGRDAEAVLKLETARQIYDENHHPTGGMSCTLLLQALRMGR